MTEFTSSIQSISCSAERVFAKLSDLNNLNLVEPMLPADKVSDFNYDSDTCSFKVDPVGKMSIAILEREPFKTIKLGSKESPIEFFFWIQLVEVSPDETRMKLTLRADLPFFLKAMLTGKLEEGLEQVAVALSKISY